jgi:beta-galactosidase
VAWQQLPLAGRPQRAPRRRTVAVERDGGTLVLAASGARAVVAAAGALRELTFDGRSILAAPPRLQLWRAAIDNDGLRLLPGNGAGTLPRWLDLGLDHLDGEVEDVRATRTAVEVVERLSGRGRRGDVLHRVRYRMDDGGALLVEHDVELGSDLRDLPRMGALWLLAPGLERLAWYGPGPLETYSDRRAAALVGRHESTVTDEYVPYVLPQEHGHHCDARWLSLEDEGGFGVRVDGSPTIGFSTSHLAAEDLFAARHTVDLAPRAEVVLSLDHRQRGLGTASCGPDTSDEHKLLEGHYRFGYALSTSARRSAARQASRSRSASSRPSRGS